jgi:hypothetical protein
MLLLKSAPIAWASFVLVHSNNNLITQADKVAIPKVKVSGNNNWSVAEMFISNNKGLIYLFSKILLGLVSAPKNGTAAPRHIISIAAVIIVK